MDSEAVRRVGGTLVEYSVRQCCDIQERMQVPAEERISTRLAPIVSGVKGENIVRPKCLLLTRVLSNVRLGVPTMIRRIR